MAISVGIGLFIALIGFVDAGFVRRMPDVAKTTVPVQLGNGGSLQGWPVVVFVIGLALVIALWVLKVRGAILISILATTVIAIVIEAIGNLGQGSAENPTGWALTVPTLPGSPSTRRTSGPWVSSTCWAASSRSVSSLSYCWCSR